MTETKNKPSDKFTTYNAKQLERGYKKIHVWVPAEDEEKAKAYCENLRKKKLKRESE